MPEVRILSRLAALKLGADIRGSAARATVMEEAAKEMVSLLFSRLQTPDSTEPACVLVRFFKTHAYGDLPAELQATARAAAGDAPLNPWNRCLTLLATAGVEPHWNRRSASVAHQAIPLISESSLARSPMIARMLADFGVDTQAILRPAAQGIEMAATATYNVFHVPDAVDSPVVPAQATFVRPYSVASVLGFGAALTDADLYVIILFSRVHIDEATAALFHGIALQAKLALLPFPPEATFAAGAHVPVA